MTTDLWAEVYEEEQHHVTSPRAWLRVLDRGVRGGCLIFFCHLLEKFENLVFQLNVLQ